jgi:hypothetical protein
MSPRTWLISYSALLAAGALTVGGALLTAGYGIERPALVIFLAAAAVAGERWSVRLTDTTELTSHLLPTVFAAVVLGPLPAGIVAAASMLGDPAILERHSGQSPYLKWVTYTSSRFLTGVLAGFITQTTNAAHSTSIGAIVVAAFAAMAVSEALDFAFAAMTSRVRGRPMSAFVTKVGPVALTSFLVYAPVVVALALAYIRVSPWTMLLFVVPGIAFQRLYTLYQRERRLTDELRDANETLARANLSFAAALVATLDARDRYTAGHSAAVAIYSRDIASRMGLPTEIQDKVYLCGLVHDIGKIGLPPGLLEKPGALTLDERRAMQEHSAIGERILANVEQYEDIALIVRHHHERIDGEGYPDRLHGHQIPALAKIIAVADAYNAMTSDRPYRDAMPSRVARLRLAQAVESQFDTAAVAAFEAVLASAAEDYRLALGPRFQLFSDQRGALGVDPEERAFAGAA